MKTIRFDEQVAIVTGAGGGLGADYAKSLAERGAKVVVNDFGGSIDGEGAGSRVADKIVDEIETSGGEAVANYGSVENGEDIVNTALDTYGRIDIVINNAGILRDVSFKKMTDDDWLKIQAVHLFGAYKVTRAAWPVMLEQSYGRIVNTASAAGIYGNFGQANYAAAKLGLVGFTNTLAIEGRTKNVLANVIAPIAGSRLLETVADPALVAALKPGFVTPLVLRLCASHSKETGSLFEVAAGWMAKLRWERSLGAKFSPETELSVEDVDGRWNEIVGFEKSEHPKDVAEASRRPLANIGVEI